MTGSPKNEFNNIYYIQSLPHILSKMMEGIKIQPKNNLIHLNNWNHCNLCVSARFYRTVPLANMLSQRSFKGWAKVSLDFLNLTSGQSCLESQGVDHYITIFTGFVWIPRSVLNWHIRCGFLQFLYVWDTWLGLRLSHERRSAVCLPSPGSFSCPETGTGGVICPFGETYTYPVHMKGMKGNLQFMPDWEADWGTQTKHL